MAATNSHQKLRIAISGGGLAGAAIANAVINHAPHLEVHVYESAPTFSERGAAVGLAINAQKALDAIVPSAADLLARAGAVSMNSTRVVVGSGPKAGSLVFDLAGMADPGLVVHRAALLRELLAPLPASCLHAGKKLVSITDDDDGDRRLKLRFEDGSVDTADALIGADGIFGFVRQHVLGDNNEPPAAAGWWDCRNIVPFEKAEAKLGAQYFEEIRQYGWVGERAFVMHDVLDGGKSVQCVCSGVEDGVGEEGREGDGGANNNRKRPLTRPFLEKSLAAWLDGPVARNMIDLILDQPNPEAYAQWEHKTTSTYARGAVCIAGDAAHAMTPWQGSGASQALEDAVVLAAVLGRVAEAKRGQPEGVAQAATEGGAQASKETRAQIEAAFKAYDAIRRPRAQAIIDSSRLTGRIMSGLEAENVGTNPEELAAALGPRWGFIYDFDIGRHRDEALERMRGLL